MSDLKKIWKKLCPISEKPRLGCESLTPCHRRACGCRADIQVRVFEKTIFVKKLVNSRGYSSDAACCCSVLLQCAVAACGNACHHDVTKNVSVCVCFCLCVSVCVCVCVCV